MFRRTWTKKSVDVRVVRGGGGRGGGTGGRGSGRFYSKNLNVILIHNRDHGFTVTFKLNHIAFGWRSGLIERNEREGVRGRILLNIYLQQQKFNSKSQCKLILPNKANFSISDYRYLYNSNTL